MDLDAELLRRLANRYHDSRDEDLRELSRRVHANDALLIAACTEKHRRLGCAMTTDGAGAPHAAITELAATVSESTAYRYWAEHFRGVGDYVSDC